MEFEETLKRFVNGEGEHRNIPTPGYRRICIELT